MAAAAVTQLASSRAAALVSRHAPTCRRVTQSLGAVGLRVQSAPLPSELPIAGLSDVAAVLVDLDVDPSLAPALLVQEARRGYPEAPVVAVAGIEARARLLDALCEAGVDHVLPKRGAQAGNLPRGGLPVLDGPFEHDLFSAVRRLLDGPTSPGVTPYLLAGANVHACTARSSADKDRALEELEAFLLSMRLGSEHARRIAQAAEELLMNALYDAPRDPQGVPRHLHSDRREAVSLDAAEAIEVRWGCDGQTFAVSVADPFGSLGKEQVTERLRTVVRGVPRPRPGVASAGLGLVMAYVVSNQLIFSVAPGRLTEATAVLHVGGSNRVAQERGTAVHFYRPQQGPRQ
jgi:hypothetical protein